MNKYKSMSAAMAVLLATGAAGAALAQPSASVEMKKQKDGQDDAAEFSRIKSAKLTLGDAIQAAERDGGGKAVNAWLEGEHDTAAFEVEVMTADGSKTVSVDGRSGVVKPIADDAQGDGEGND
ncbi:MULTISPECIES: PepSY domain-containing protein [Agrobacterium]|uniref:PepSY domain-containing protein n=1 Tax=Agrobacterium TaxID=357 RepID=UPI002A111E18|nr:PepSY domain-containing protein [Agrobacterium sp. rho-13.3]MDX8311863.1 PepSY domain-containing protein [Agrobacterium sp. rho-13.3]